VVIWSIFPDLVCSDKKNLATLLDVTAGCTLAEDGLSSFMD
jgi:hypothetical protein